MAIDERTPRTVVAGSVTVRAAAVQSVSGGDVDISASAVQAVRGEQVDVARSSVLRVTGARVTLDQSTVLSVTAREVQARSVRTLVLLAPRVKGDVRTVIDWKSAIAIGVGAVLMRRLLRLVRFG